MPAAATTSTRSMAKTDTSSSGYPNRITPNASQSCKPSPKIENTSANYSTKSSPRREYKKASLDAFFMPLAVGYWLSFLRLRSTANAVKNSRFVLRNSFTPICRQKVVVGVHRVKSPAMDSTKTYSHCRAFRDVQLMLPFHDKLLFLFATSVIQESTNLLRRSLYKLLLFVNDLGDT